MSDFFPFVANHLWQSTVFAVIAGLLTLALRQNQARARYWLWLAASLKFLIPFSLLIAAGHSLSSLAPSVPARSSVVTIVAGVSQPFGDAAVHIGFRRVAEQTSALPLLVLILWTLGAVAVATLWTVRYRRVRALARAASPLALDAPVAALSTPALLEPGIYGVIRPVLLLPEGITERLTTDELQAVIAHELCHVQRRDNLSAAVHMVVEALFWFHPLVWWIGSRMLEERELACDEEVVRAGGDPQVYAESILKVCKFYFAAPVQSVAGVTGADLKKRIAGIMVARLPFQLSFGRKVLLGLVAAAAIAAPLAVGLLNAAPPPADLRFEVASIKVSHDPPPMRFGLNFQPGGRLLGYNMTVRQMIEFAYGLPLNKDYVTGGGDWPNSVRFNIIAKAPDGVITPAMPVTAREEKYHAMMKTMLAEAFELSLRPEMKQMSIYALIVAKGGPKLTPAAPRDCDTQDCHGFHGGRPPGVTGHTVTTGDLADILSFFGDRPVQDLTGITGNYDMTIPGWTDPLRPPLPGVVAGLEAGPDPNAPDIFTVLQQTLGLKLEARKSKVQTYVIEKIAKPPEN